MYRLLAIAVFLAAAAFQPSLEAQMRTTQRSGVTAPISVGPRFRAVQPPPRGRFGVMSPRPFGRRASFVGPVFRHNSRFHIFFGNSCFTGRFFDPFFCQQFFFRNRFLFAQPVFLSYPAYTTPSYQVAEPAASPVADGYGDLAVEVRRLTSEIGQLRQEQALLEQARQVPPKPSRLVEENAPTILVFRDAHRNEVRNYAIVGHTLWVFTEQRAQKIPISDLDVEATRKVNADRGVEVRFP